VNSEDVRTIVEAATLAPSVHNTQPWRFAAHDGQIDVFADRARQLEVIDPDGRELHISCGAAVAFAAVAVRALDHAVEVTVRPDPDNPDHLASIKVGARLPATAEDRRLADALPLRYTARERFDDRPVPPALVAELRRLAAAGGVWIWVIDTPDDTVVTEVLLARADDQESADPAYRDELAAWRRQAPGDVDGIPRAAVPDTPVAERGSSFRLRDFDLDGTVATPAATREQPPPAEHPLVLVLGTDGDGPDAWLRAGQALGLVLLRAAADGVVGSPMTQVLELPATRAMLTRALGVIGYPQMLLRLGYGQGRPTTHRRPINEVLTG
jgi:nitroreductase